MEKGKNNKNVVEFITNTFGHGSDLLNYNYGKNKIEKSKKNKENFGNAKKIKF